MSLGALMALGGKLRIFEPLKEERNVEVLASCVQMNAPLMLLNHLVK